MIVVSDRLGRPISSVEILILAGEMNESGTLQGAIKVGGCRIIAADLGQLVIDKTHGQVLLLGIVPTLSQIIHIVPGVDVKGVLNHGAAQYILDLRSAHACSQLLDLLLLHEVALWHIDSIDAARAQQHSGGQSGYNQFFVPHQQILHSIQ
jgi:hypothetical protein